MASQVGDGTAQTCRIRVLFASPEVFPLAKTVGVTDVSAALSADGLILEIGVRVQTARLRVRTKAFPAAGRLNDAPER